MKNYGDLGGNNPPRPTASTNNTLLDLHNSSQDTQPHSLTVTYSTPQTTGINLQALRESLTVSL